MSQKHYFTSQKKINSKYFKDFNFISLKVEKKTISEINDCIVQIFNKNENKNFRNIKQIQNFLNKTEFYNLKKDPNLMTKLEKILCSYFTKIKILNKFIKGIQFPMDIRIVHPKLPNKIKKKKYLTSSIHCDTWTEEPKDIINVILYLAVDKKSPKIDILKTSEKDIDIYKKYANTYQNKFFLNSKKYFSILRELQNKQTYNLKHVNGQMMVFNGFTPHQTIREGKKVRLSLEFRLKTKNPYKEVSKWSKVNNHSRYWSLPNGNEDNFAQRLKCELHKIKKLQNHQKLIRMRNKEMREKFNLEF